MPKHCKKSKSDPALSRRDFLRLAGLGAAGLLLQSCRPSLESAGSGSIQAEVAVSQARLYNRDTIQQKMAELIGSLGGLGDVVTPGDSVAIKTNLTGGLDAGQLPGIDPYDSFVTHPEIVRALIKDVKAAGASEVFIVEAVYEWESYSVWGYEEIAEDTGATLIDLNEAGPYPDFHEASVGSDGFVYESFIFNPLINEVDVFMSVSKMKNHFNAGVTHTMKNLYGLVPYRYYRLDDSHEWRSGFHGEGAETRTRLPQIILDLNMARPIDFALVDGVRTTQGGEGPWIPTMAPISPGLLVAGKNCVATDAVATALMGHDPLAEYPDAPFLRGDNHLNIAREKGLGTNRLEEIEVIGPPLSSLVTPFSPAW